MLISSFYIMRALNKNKYPWLPEKCTKSNSPSNLIIRAYINI